MSAETNCPICQSEPVQPIAFQQCNHSVCFRCFVDYLRNTQRGTLPKCPLCRDEIVSFSGEESDLALHLLRMHMQDVALSAEEMQMAQHQMDMDYRMQQIEYEHQKTVRNGLQGLAAILPLVSMVSACFVFVTVAKDGYYSMAMLIVMIGSHMLSHQIKPRTLHFPQRRFANPNVARLVNRSHVIDPHYYEVE